MCSTATRRRRRAKARLLLTPLVASLLAVASPADETNPRIPGQRLMIDVSPWYCSACTEDDRGEEPDEPATYMKMSANAMAKKIGLRCKWYAIESPNFRIFSTLSGSRVKHSDSPFAADDLARLKEIFPKFKLGGGSTYVNSHQRAHLYHVRLERVFAHFAALTGNRCPYLGMGSHFEIYLFESKKQFFSFAEKVAGRPNFGQRCLQHHEKCRRNFQVMSSACGFFKGKEREFNNVVIHNAVHLLVNGHRNFYTDVWAWLEEGLAHYYERRESTRHNYFCLGDQKPPSMLVRGNWRKKVRYAVRHKKDVPLSRWCEKLQPHSLSEMERAVSWSMVDWLFKTDPVRLGTLLDRSGDCRRKVNATSAIREVFGVTPDVLHDRWRAWVLKEYRS